MGCITILCKVDVKVETPYFWSFQSKNEGYSSLYNTLGKKNLRYDYLLSCETKQGTSL